MGRWGLWVCRGLGVLILEASSQGTAFAGSYRWQQGQGEAAFRHTFRQAWGEMHSVEAPREKDMTILDEDNTEGGEGAFQRYLEQLVLNAEDLQIEGNDGRLQVHLRFLQDHQHFAFNQDAETGFGQAYAVALARDVRFAVFYSDDMVYANDLTGLQVLVNLPLIPDELDLRQFTFNITTQQAALRATAVYNFVELVARASVRLRHFDGVDWFIPILDSLPGFFEGARFRFNPR